MKNIVMRYKSAKLVDVDVCPVLGIKLTYDNSHASYLTASFDELLSEFLNQSQIDIESVRLTNPVPDDVDQRGILADPELLERRVAYQRNNAHLQLLSAEANLHRLKS